MADLSEKSGQEVAKISRSKGRDADYWKTRLFHAIYRHGGERRETKNWCVRIQYAGRREIFNLDTPNKIAAAGRAKERYEFLRAHGWEETVREFKHGHEKERVEAEKSALTVGHYIELTSQIASDLGARTINSYAACLRRLVAELQERPFDPKNPEKWRSAIDRTRLDEITASAVEKWKVRRLKTCNRNPIEEEKTKITANSILRQCRALFGRKFVPKLLEEGVQLPGPLPFANVQLFSKDTSGKFSHAVQPEVLLKAAVEELSPLKKEGETDQDAEARGQMFLAFLLSFAAGLRKREADTLEWKSVDLEKGEIRIQQTEFFKPKTNASARPVRLDVETVEILRVFQVHFSDDRFVLRSECMPKPGAAHAYYRAEKTWKALGKWLKEHGVNDPKPIHYCRKAITALMAKNFGIFAAQRHARHTTPSITARYYSDGEESLPPGIGRFFTRTS